MAMAAGERLRLVSERWHWTAYSAPASHIRKATTPSVRSASASVIVRREGAYLLTLRRVRRERPCSLRLPGVRRDMPVKRSGAGNVRRLLHGCYKLVTSCNVAVAWRGIKRR